MKDLWNMVKSIVVVVGIYLLLSQILRDVTVPGLNRKIFEPGAQFLEGISIGSVNLRPLVTQSAVVMNDLRDLLNNLTDFVKGTAIILILVVLFFLRKVGLKPVTSAL